MLYKPQGAFGFLIRLKTWHRVAHVEMYLGNGISTASRDGKGVDRYPVRDTELIFVLRPKTPLDMTKVSDFVDRWVGTPYGWLDLFNFMGFAVDRKGIVCSPYITRALRAGGCPIFNDEDPNLVAPFEFLESELLTKTYQ